MVPAVETYIVPTLQALARGDTRDFRSIHTDVKWKLGLTPEEVERPLHRGKRTEVSYGLSQALQRMIDMGLITNPTRTHYRITDEGLRQLQEGADLRSVV